MADLDLRVDYQDDILDSTANTKRKYNIVDEDGNVVQSGISLEDVSVYSQTGDSFGATDINKTNQAILDLNQSLTEVQTDTYTSEYLNGNIIVAKNGNVVTIRFPSLNANMPLKQNVKIAELDDKYKVSVYIGSVSVRVQDTSNNHETVVYLVQGTTVYFYKYGTGTNGTTTSGTVLTYITD